MTMDKPKAMNTEAVLPRSRANDEAVLKAVYDRHFSPVFRLALRYTGSAEDAEEIAQETFAKAFRHLGQVWGRDPDSLGPWLRRICINNSISHLRSAKRRGRGLLVPLDDILHEPPSREASPEDRLYIAQAWARLDLAVAKLSPRQRMIFDLRFRQHKDLKEIAELVGCTEGNIKTHSMRILAKLRRRLGPLWEAP